MKSNVISQGHMTLPVETGQEEIVLDLLDRWHVDALRDSDGTQMPDSLLTTEKDIYSVICLVRGDQEYANQHPEFLHRKYFISKPVTAFKPVVTINPLDGFSQDKYQIDNFSEPALWWEVRDRTSGKVISTDEWRFNDKKGIVTIENIILYHEYTVTFLVRQVWDSVSMYNALTNDWSGSPIKSLDPYHPECRAYLIEYFKQWLANHPKTTVVRFTTFAYLFVIDTGDKNQDIYRDWTGYGETVSPQALQDFEKR